MWVVGFVASLNLVACGAGQRWPTARVVADTQFMQRARPVQSVDILPVDFQMWTYEGNQEDPAVIRQRFDALATAALNNKLASRGYQVAANIGWDGSYSGPDGKPARAMEPAAVQRTIYALSGYGKAVQQARRGLLVPYLPDRLGTRTASDATLYVGGWSYVGVDPKPSSGKGNKVAKGILIGLFAVVIVIAVIAAAKGKGGGGGGAGKVAGSAAKAAGGVAKGAVKAVGAAVRATPRLTARVMGQVLRGVSAVTNGASRPQIHIDAWGRSNTGTHVQVYGGRPNYFEEDRAPHKGRSQMQIEMTLVDNRTGLVLWHARQRYPVSGARPEHVTGVVDRMMAAFPSVGRGPGG
jgi:hypothetical protein